MITNRPYHNKKTYVEILGHIPSVIHKKVPDKVRNSQYFGIMLNESIDISIKGHLVVFATFLEDVIQVCIFLVLLYIPENKKDATMIYDLLLIILTPKVL
jgi:hypothetical protein